MARRCHSQAEQLLVARREPEQDRTLGHLSGHLTLPRILVPEGRPVRGLEQASRVFLGPLRTCVTRTITTQCARANITWPHVYHV